MYDHSLPNLQVTKSDIRPHIKLAVSLVITHGHFNLPQGFVWVHNLANITREICFTELLHEDLSSIIIIYTVKCNTKILEVHLFAFAYRLFHRDFSPLNRTFCS